MSCKCNCDKELASLKGTLSGPFIDNRVVIETQNEASREFAPQTEVVEVRHIKEGYACYLINYPERWLPNMTRVHIKSLDKNSATFAIINNTLEPVWGSLGKTTWLCVPEQ